MGTGEVTFSAGEAGTSFSFSLSGEGWIPVRRLKIGDCPAYGGGVGGAGQLLDVIFSIGEAGTWLLSFSSFFLPERARLKTGDCPAYGGGVGGFSLGEGGGKDGVREGG